MLRPTWRKLVVLVLVLAAVFAGCQVLNLDDKPTHTVLDKRSGVRVDVFSDDMDARIVLSHNQPPRASVPLFYDILSDPVKIDFSGKMNQDAQITFGYPEDSKLEDVFVVRWHEETGQWVPQGARVDSGKKTVSVVTGQFSYWALARWKNDGTAQEQLEAMAQSKLYENSKLIKGITGLLSIPPSDPGCRRSLPTLKVDTSQFFPGFDKQGLICLHYEEQDGKYRITIGNNAGFPINFKFPRGFTIGKVEPFRGNIITVLAQIARQTGGENTLTLHGGQRVTLTLNKARMGSDVATVVSKLDYGEMLLRVGGTLLEAVIPVLPDEGIDIGDPKKLKAYRDLVACTVREASTISQAAIEARRMGMLAGATHFQKAFLSGLRECSKEFVAFMNDVILDPIAESLRRGEDYVVNAAANQLGELAKRRFLFFVDIWENADAFSAMFRSWWQIFYHDDGKIKTKVLTFTVSDFPKGEAEADLPFGWCVYSNPERRGLYGNPPKFWFDPCRNQTPVPGYDYWKDYYKYGGR